VADEHRDLAFDVVARGFAAGEVTRRTALRRLLGLGFAAALPSALLARPARAGDFVDCSLELDGTSCSDGNVCNGVETCQGGVCAPGIALDCDDGNQCTTDSCDPVVGCAATDVADGTPCNQNGGTICMSGTCVPGSDPTVPNTFITRDPGTRTRDRTPSFKFRSEPTGATFECSIDGGRFKVCSSPHQLKRLSLGRHVFKVRAVLENVRDPTPAEHRFKVVRKS